MTEPADVASFSGAYSLDEVIEIEELGGCPIDKIMEANWGRPLRAVAYIIGRRANPEFTLEDAGKIVLNVTFADPEG